MYERFLYGIFDGHLQLTRAIGRLAKAGFDVEPAHLGVIETYFLPSVGSFMAAGPVHETNAVELEGDEEEMSHAMSALQPRDGALRQLVEMVRRKGMLLVVKCEDVARREIAKKILVKANAKIPETADYNPSLKSSAS